MRPTNQCLQKFSSNIEEIIWKIKMIIYSMKIHNKALNKIEVLSMLIFSLFRKLKSLIASTNLEEVIFPNGSGYGSMWFILGLL